MSDSRFERLLRDVARAPSLPVRDQLRPGDRVGRHRVERLAAKGGMGEVYLARDEKLDRAVALKLLRPTIAGTAGDELLRDEARALARLRHPNVVTVHEVGEYGTCPYIVMEWVDGETLRTRLEREGRLAWPSAARLARTVCGGLGHAHDVGVLHLDLKPENILLDRRGEVRIVDFGLARSVSGSAGSSGGTPGYVAPEMRRGAPPDVRADLFALGVILGELLSGRRGGALPRQTPRALATLCHHLQSTAPARRPATTAEVVARLDAILAPEPPRRRRGLGAGAALALTVASTMAALVTRRRDAPPISGSDALRPPPPALRTARKLTNVVPELPVLAVALRDDGRWLAYADERAVFVRPPEGGLARPLELGGSKSAAPECLAFRPDGRLAVFVHRADGSSGYEAVDPESGASEPLSRGHGRCGALATDGTAVAWTDVHELVVYSLAADRPDVRVPMPDVYLDTNVSFDRSGERVFVTGTPAGDADGEGHVFAVEARTGVRRTIAVIPGVYGGGHVGATVSDDERVLLVLPPRPLGAPATLVEVVGTAPPRVLAEVPIHMPLGVSASPKGAIAIVGATVQYDVFEGRYGSGSTLDGPLRRLTLSDANEAVVDFVPGTDDLWTLVADDGPWALARLNRSTGLTEPTPCRFGGRMVAAASVGPKEGLVTLTQAPEGPVQLEICRDGHVSPPLTLRLPPGRRSATPLRCAVEVERCFVQLQRDGETAFAELDLTTGVATERAAVATQESDQFSVDARGERIAMMSVRPAFAALVDTRTGRQGPTAPWPERCVPWQVEFAPGDELWALGWCFGPPRDEPGRIWRLRGDQRPTEIFRTRHLFLRNFRFGPKAQVALAAANFHSDVYFVAPP